MSILTSFNITSLRLSGRMRETTNQLTSVFERLASGTRLIRAASDPSGLAIADSLRNQGRLMAMASRNANDALSITNLTDGALSEISDILTRMSELALQGSSSIYTNQQRSSLQSEFAALGEEIQRISGGLSFNSIPLLSASADLSIQVGITASQSDQIILPSALATLAALGIGNETALTFSLTGDTSEAGSSASVNAFSAVEAALGQVSLQRGRIGAAASRLSGAISYLSIARENILAAESTIRDSDTASDTAELIKLQILQQAQISLLAQAKKQPELILKLLE